MSTEVTTTSETPVATAALADGKPVDPTVDATTGSEQVADPVTPETTEGVEAVAAEVGKTEPDPREIEIDQRLQAIAKREREAVLSKKAEKEALSRANAAEEKLERLRTDPRTVLQELGITFKDLAQIELNDGKLTPEMEAKILREKLEKIENSKKAEKADAEAQAISDFKDKIKETCTTSDEFELIAANDAHELVYSVIEEVYEKTGQIMAIEDAAKQVEEQLEDQVTNRILKTKKIAARLAPISGEEPPKTPEAEPAKTPAAPVVTKSADTNPAPVPSSASYIQDDEASKKAAADYLRKAMQGAA